MHSNVNIRLKHTLHGSPHPKYRTMCNTWNSNHQTTHNPWNSNLSDNTQPMELQPVRQCTTHGTPTCWTMHNPWNSNLLDNVQPMELQPSDNAQPMELKPRDNVQPIELQLQHVYLLIFHAHPAFTPSPILHPDTSLSLPQAPTPTLPNDDKHNDAKHDQLSIKKS